MPYRLGIQPFYILYLNVRMYEYNFEIGTLISVVGINAHSIMFH